MTSYGIVTEDRSRGVLRAAANIPIVLGIGDEARFWSKVARAGPGDCWDWTAGLSDKGYGRFKVGRQTLRAIRIAWAIDHGRDPGELLIRHTCDRPPCCNPAHLVAGTHADNAQDKVERGRCVTRPQNGENNAAARLTAEQIGEIVDAFREGGGYLTNIEIARDYPVGDSLISRIRTGRSWQREAAQFGWQPAIDFLERAAA